MPRRSARSCFQRVGLGGAERSLIRALELNPQHGEAMLIYGRLLEAVGQLERGLAIKQQALERDPLPRSCMCRSAQLYCHLRRYDASIVWANRALAIESGTPCEATRGSRTV